MRLSSDSKDYTADLVDRSTPFGVVYPTQNVTVSRARPPARCSPAHTSVPPTVSDRVPSEWQPSLGARPVGGNSATTHQRCHRVIRR